MPYPIIVRKEAPEDSIRRNDITIIINEVLSSIFEKESLKNRIAPTRDRINAKGEFSFVSSSLKMLHISKMFYFYFYYYIKNSSGG